MRKNKGFVYAFLLYLFMVPLIPEVIIEKVPITDLYIVLLLGVYIIYSIVNRERRTKLFNNIIKFISDKIIIFIGIVLVIMLGTVMYSQDRIIAIKEAIRFSTYIGILFFIIFEIDMKREKENIIKVIYYPALIVSIFGIVQKFTGIGLTVNTNGYLRIESTLGHPNSLGVYLTILIFPLIMISINEKRTSKKIIYLTTAILMISNILLCWSRNSWIALAFGGVLLVIFYNWKVIYAFLVGGVVVLMIPTIFSRVLDIGTKILSDGRIKHWVVALKMFLDKPIGGVGNGNYVTLHESYVQKYPNLLVVGEENFPTHNSYLKVLSELGILGFIPFLITNILIVIRTYFVYKSSEGEKKNIILGIFIAILVFMQVNLLDNMWFVPKVTTIYWVLVAIIISISYNKKLISGR